MDNPRLTCAHFKQPRILSCNWTICRELEAAAYGVDGTTGSDPLLADDVNTFNSCVQTFKEDSKVLVLYSLSMTTRFFPGWGELVSSPDPTLSQGETVW